MTDAQVEALMKACQRGEVKLDAANNLLADCYGALGRLLLENQALHKQVKVLQSAENSYQTGYDDGRRMGSKVALSERQQLKRELEALRVK